MTFFTGHIPDAPEVVAARLGIHLYPDIGAIRAGTLPLRSANRYSLPESQGGPGVLDQQDTSTCEGHAHASAVTHQAAMNGSLIELRSPVAPYYGALLASAQTLADGTLAPLCDQGTTPSAIRSGLALWGIPSAAAFGQYPASSAALLLSPSDPTLGVNGLRVLKPVEPERLYQGRVMRLRGAFFVQSLGDQRCRDMMALLAAKVTFTISIPASGSDFQGYRGGVLSATSGPIDHCVRIVDYQWDGTNLSSVMFYGVNSWGDLWGESDVDELHGGLFRADRSFIDQFADPCAMQWQLEAA